MFVAVEGPNGVGKSTVAAALAAALGGSGREVLLTAEPTRTALGELVRALESELEPRAPGAGLRGRPLPPPHQRGPTGAATRRVGGHRPVRAVLVGAAAAGWARPCRGVAVQQARHRADPVGVLVDDEDTIAARLAARSRRSRLEAVGSPERELRLYADAYHHLAGLGWPQLMLEGRGRTPAELASLIVEHMTRLKGWATCCRS
jgi:dTMP kinase